MDKSEIAAQRAHIGTLRKAVIDAYIKKCSEPRKLGVLAKIERAYLWLLPWAGYIALLSVASQTSKPAILTGWILLLVWQIFAVGSHQEHNDPAKRSIWRLAWMLAPAMLLATQSWDGSAIALANALIELTIVEVAALIFALVAVMVMQPGEGKDMAWPGIIIMGIFVVAFLTSFVRAWLVLNPDPEWIRVGALLTAFVTQIVLDWRWLRPLAAGKLHIRDPMESKFGLPLILVQILLWLLMPVLFWLAR